MNLDDDTQASLARIHRGFGATLQEIADKPGIDHGVEWVRKVTRETEDME